MKHYLYHQHQEHRSLQALLQNASNTDNKFLIICPIIVSLYALRNIIFLISKRLLPSSLLVSPALSYSTKYSTPIIGLKCRTLIYYRRYSSHHPSLGSLHEF